MKKRSTSKDDQDIPEYTREQLGVGVREKARQLAEQSGTPLISRQSATVEIKSK